MDRNDLLKRVKSNLQDAFGKRLQRVILYGSEARGQAGPESDIDFLALLNGPVNFGQDLRTCIHALYPLVLELGRPIDVRPVDADVFESQEFPLYRIVKREGIPA
jgi:predicted nucleotidyltransferase